MPLLRSKKGQLIPAIIVILVILILIFLFSWYFVPKPQVVSAELTIDPDKFKITENAMMIVTIENNEKISHAIKLRFITNPLVHIYIGETELPKETPYSGNYSYTLTLAALAKIDQPFIVKVPELPIGIPEQKFYIEIEVFVDGVKIDSMYIEFTAIAR